MKENLERNATSAKNVENLLLNGSMRVTETSGETIEHYGNFVQRFSDAVFSVAFKSSVSVNMSYTTPRCIVNEDEQTNRTKAECGRFKK